MKVSGNPLLRWVQGVITRFFGIQKDTAYNKRPLAPVEDEGPAIAAAAVAVHRQRLTP